MRRICDELWSNRNFTFVYPDLICFWDHAKDFVKDDGDPFEPNKTYWTLVSNSSKNEFLFFFCCRKALEKHRDQSGIHKAIIRKLKSTQEVLEEDLTSFVNPDGDDLYPETSRVLRLIYHGVQSLYLSFAALARMVALFVYHNVEIGLGCRSENVHTDMSYSVGLSFHARLVQHVQTMETPCALVLGK